jgi:hypothetical protein
MDCIELWISTKEDCAILIGNALENILVVENVLVAENLLVLL